MEREQLIIDISVETKNTLQSLNSVTGGFAKLGTTGEASVNSVTTALKELRKVRNDSFDTRQVAEFNRAIRELEFNAKGIKDIGIRNDIGEQARRSRVALYGLNQVVRDLPFGFIAISNNLPVLADQFQALIRETGSVTKAFGAFAKGLVGGAGISIALSAVISLITTAVQKYGSLGAAVKALTGNLTSAERALNEYNKALDGQIGKAFDQINQLELLNRIRKDETVGIVAQAAAYKGLNVAIEKTISSTDKLNIATREIALANREFYSTANEAIKSNQLADSQNKSLFASINKLDKAIFDASQSKKVDAQQVKAMANAYAAVAPAINSVTASLGENTALSQKLSRNYTAVGASLEKIAGSSGLISAFLSSVGESAAKLNVQIANLNKSNAQTAAGTKRLVDDLNTLSAAVERTGASGEVTAAQAEGLLKTYKSLGPSVRETARTLGENGDEAQKLVNTYQALGITLGLFTSNSLKLGAGVAGVKASVSILVGQLSSLTRESGSATNANTKLAASLKALESQANNLAKGGKVTEQNIAALRKTYNSLSPEVINVTAALGDNKVAVDQINDSYQKISLQIDALATSSGAFASYLKNIGSAAVQVNAEVNKLALANQLTSAQTERLSNAYNNLKVKLDAAKASKVVSREQSDELRAANANLGNEVTKVTNELDKNRNVMVGVVGATNQLNNTVNELALARRTEAELTRDAAAAQLEYAKKVIMVKIQMEAASSAIGQLQAELYKTRNEGPTFMDKARAGAENLKIAITDIGRIFTTNPLKQVNVGNFISGENVFKEKLTTIEGAIDNAFENFKKIVDKFTGEGGRLEDVIGNLFGDGGKTKDAIKQNFDELLIAQIDMLKARIDGLKGFSVEKYNLEKELAAKELQLANNQARRTIQNSKALYTKLLANAQEYANKLSKIKFQVAEVDSGTKLIEKYIDKFNEKAKEKIFTFDQLLLPDPGKIDTNKLNEYLDRISNNSRAFSESLIEQNKLILQSMQNTVQGLGQIFDTLIDGVLEDFVTKGAVGFETLIQNVGRLAIQLTKAALKAFVLNTALKALGFAAPGFGSLFESALGFGRIGRQGLGGNNLNGFRQAAPSFRPSSSLIGGAALTTRVSGKDLEIILNRSLRANGRIGG